MVLAVRRLILTAILLDRFAFVGCTGQAISAFAAAVLVQLPAEGL